MVVNLLRGKLLEKRIGLISPALCLFYPEGDNERIFRELK